MFKRIAIVLTFLAAFSAAGLVTPGRADAHRGWGWGRPYGGYYGTSRSYYSSYYGRPYGSYYYGPRVYRPYYYGSYYGPSDYYYYGRPGISIGVGF